MKTPRSILTLALAFPAAKSNRNKSDTFKCAGPGPGPVSDCMYIECAIYSLDYVQSRHAHCSAAATALSRQCRQRERGGSRSRKQASRGNFATPVIAAIILVSLSCLQIYYHDQLPFSLLLLSSPSPSPFPLSPLLPIACLGLTRN